MKENDKTIELEYSISGWGDGWGAYSEKIAHIHDQLHASEDKLLSGRDEKLVLNGWVDWPEVISESLIAEIEAAARDIHRKCSALVVIGVGGSYLGAKACIELLTSPFYNEHAGSSLGFPKIYFAGHHVSSIYYSEFFKQLDQEEVCLCAVSKSGSTLEPSIVFKLMQKYMDGRYGSEAAERIWVITDREKGPWREEVRQNAYHSFEIPKNMGGRYSVLSPVGMLPAAAAGIDIRSILEGARDSMREYLDPSIEKNTCYRYAIIRNMLQMQGKYIEIFEVYEGKLRYFTEWLKQLFAESECKDGKGILPVSFQMSTDLHSMGQFLQDGRQIFFETVITAAEIMSDISLEGIGPAGRAGSMHELNEIIQRSVRKAHQANYTPQLCITVPDISPYSFGRMVYFFEKACAVSCMLTGVDPFDQPGVEAYKRNIKMELGLLKAERESCL